MKLTCLLVIGSAAGFLLFAQTPQLGSNTSAPTTIRATSQEVVLDMVFRDKKGKSVKDIRPEEIHITEEGTDQKLKSFRLIEGKTAQVLSEATAAPGTAPKSIPLDPMREIRLVTFAFEGLGSPDDKRFFRETVKGLLEMAPEPNLYYSIVTIDQKLHLLQPFTADHAALTQTLVKALSWSFIQFQSQSAEVKQSLRSVISSGEPSIQTSGAAAPSQGQIQSGVAYRIAKMQYDMLDYGDSVDREFDARATMSGLTNLVKWQSTLPGRKVVVYFNPWFRIPEVLSEQYANLKGMANRGNITFYTVDTKGLISDSQSSGGRQMLKEATGDIRGTMNAGARKDVTPAQSKALEKAENAGRDNPVEWLRNLAADTGGAAIVETNDWKAPLRAATDEIRTYYEATYSPDIPALDGRFRRVAVKVDRPGVVVHTRSGYYALPTIAGQQLQTFEVPLLNALGAAPTPADFPFRATMSRFNDRGPKVEFMLTLETPLAGLTFEPHPEKKNAAVNEGLLALIKDERGDVVDKRTKDFAVQVDLDKVEGYKGGNLVQTFRLELLPGKYTVEAVAMDKLANKLSVRKAAFTVPSTSSKLSISNLVIVRRADNLKDNPISDAFYFEGGKIVPTLTEALKGGPGNVLPFYFVVYPEAGKPAPQKITMSFYSAGQLLGSADAPLPPPQKDGRIPYIANLPADRFLPGNYEIQVSVAQGDSKAEEKIAFRVE